MRTVQAEERLSWAQCVAEARQAHPDLYSALALLQQAEADKRISCGGLLPQLSFSVSGRQSGTTQQGRGPASSLSYALSAQQLLFDGCKTSNTVAGNESSIKAARYNYQAVSAAVRFALRSAFTELLKAQDQVGLAGEIASRRQNNVRLISLRYQGGREHLGSLRQAEAALAQAEFEVSQSRRALVLAQTTLASALGRDSHQPLRVAGSFKAAPLPVRKPDLGQLARNNPLFQELDARSKAARYELHAAKGAFSPQLYLTSTIERGGTFARIPLDAVDWNAGVTLSVPIYEGGIGRAKVSRAMAVVSQQNAQEKSGYLQLFDTLEASWKNLQDAWQLVGVRKQFLSAALERSTIANAQYSNGLITFNDWVIIEDNLVSAKKEYLNAGADLLIAEAQWIQAKGGGLDEQAQ